MGSVAPDELPAGRWRALALLSFAVVLAMTTWFSASAVVPQLREEWGLGDTAAAWLTIAVQLGFVAGAVASSILGLGDVVSPRIVLLAGAAGAAVANGLLLLVDGPGAAIPLRFATGLFLAGVYPQALKLMATWFRRGRGTALGIVVGALSVGSAVPHLVNGLGGLRWETVVVATSALTLAGGVSAFLLVPEGPFATARAAFDPRQAPRVFGNRGVRLASLGYFGHMWELYAMWAWFLVFATASLEARGEEVGARAAYATFAVIAAGGVGCWAGGILGDRWGRTRTTSAMMAVSGFCCVAVGLVFGGPFALLVAVGMVWGFAVVGDSAQFSTMVTELADQTYVATALALQLALGFTLTVATIWLVPYLADVFGWRFAFAFLAPGPVLGIVAMLRLRGIPQAAAIAGGRR